MINLNPEVVANWTRQDKAHFTSFKATLQKIVDFEKKATVEAEKLKPLVQAMADNERSAKLKACMKSYAAFVETSFKMRHEYV